MAICALPPEYLAWLGIADYIAQNGVKRESAGGGNQFQSTGTKGPGDFGAMLLVEAERRHLRGRARSLARKVREYVDNDREPDDS